MSRGGGGGGGVGAGAAASQRKIANRNSCRLAAPARLDVRIMKRQNFCARHVIFRCDSRPRTGSGSCHSFCAFVKSCTTEQKNGDREKKREEEAGERKKERNKPAIASKLLLYEHLKRHADIPILSRCAYF